MTTLSAAIDHAIAASIAEDRIVRVEVEDMDAALESIACEGAAADYDTDSARENDGSVDVWGWTDATAANEQDWRIRLVLA